MLELEIPLPVQANIAFENETRTASSRGLQDRVVQSYEGLVYMDFARALMESRGYGEYERMDPALLPNVYVRLPHPRLAKPQKFSTPTYANGAGAVNRRWSKQWSYGRLMRPRTGRACCKEITRGSINWWTPTSTCALGCTTSTRAILKWYTWRALAERPRILPDPAGPLQAPMNTRPCSSACRARQGSRHRRDPSESRYLRLHVILEVSHARG